MVSWNEAAETNESVVKDALVIPRSTGVGDTDFLEHLMNDLFYAENFLNLKGAADEFRKCMQKIGLIVIMKI